jgi:hypothetical protein
VLWLDKPPWGRWLIASFLVLLAVWFETRPERTVPHPFALIDIGVGESLEAANTIMREVPDGLLPPVAVGGVARRPVLAGDPLTPADVGDPETSPLGWWSFPADLPSDARAGDRVLIVLLDSLETIEGVVSAGPSSDPFGSGRGAVAVAPERAAVAASAAVEARIAVLVSGG